MKKLISFLLVLLILFQSLSFGEANVTIDELVLLIGSNQSLISGKLVAIDSENQEVAPLIIESRTYLPVRYIAESLGAEVGWNASSEEVTITDETTKIRFKIGSEVLYVNDEQLQFENPPFIMYGRTFIQLSTLLTALNKEVFFKDGVIIISDTKPLPTDNYINYLKNQLTTDSSAKMSNNDIYNEAVKSVVSISTQNNGTATGFFVTKDLILTNYHVARGAGGIAVKTSDNTTHFIEGMYWYDMINDLALIKTSGSTSSDWLTLEENEYKIGDKVLALGDPLGLEKSFSEGIISAFRFNAFLNTTSIQTDVSVSFGSSGSPLLNENGRVVGIITSGVLNEEINFASKVDLVKNIINTELKLVNEDSGDFEYNSFYGSEIESFIKKSIQAVTNKDRTLYNSFFIDDAPFINSDDDFFDEISDIYAEVNYRGFSVNTNRTGDTYLISYLMELDNKERTKYVFMYHIKYLPQSSEFKIVGNIMMSADDWVKRLDIKLDENVIEATLESEETIIVEMPKTTFDYELNFTPHDTVYDPVTKSIFMTHRQNKSIIKYNTVTKQKQTLKLDHFAENITLANNKIYVVSPVTEHDYYISKEDTYGYVGIVDPKSFELIKSIEIGIDPFDISVLNDSIYVSSGSSQSTVVINVSENTETQVSEYRIHHKGNIAIHPFRDQLYTITTESSPRDYHTYHITDNAFRSTYDSIYHGDHPLFPEFIISPDGRYLINYSGTIYTCGYDNETDMRFYTSLNNQFSSLMIDEKSNRLFAGLKDESKIVVYDLHTFELLDTLDTKETVMEMAISNNDLITIEKSFDFYGVNEYDITSTAIGSENASLMKIRKIDVSRKLNFTPHDYFYDAKTESIFMSDTSTNSLIKYDVNNDTVERLELDYPVKNLFVSDGMVYMTMPSYGYSRYESGPSSGYYGIVNAETMSLVSLLEIDLYPYDIAALDGYVIVSGSSDKQNKIHTYHESTGIRTDSDYSSGKVSLELKISENKIYAVEYKDTSPEVFVIKKGMFVPPYENPTNTGTSDPVSTDFYISPDDKYLYYTTGSIFNSNKISKIDNTFYDTFNIAYNSLAFDIEADKVYINVDDRGTINIYKYSTNEPLGRLHTEFEVKFMHVVDHQLVTIENDNGIYYVRKIDK